MQYLSFNEFVDLSEKGNVIPVYASYLADLLTPVSSFLHLRSVSNQAFLFESVEGGEKTGRYSFLGCQPYAIIRYSNNVIEKHSQGKIESFTGNIFQYLKELFRPYKTVRHPGLPRFTGGAVGYFGYETVRLIENIPVNMKIPDGLSVPEAVMMLFDTILVFDHLRHPSYIIANVFLEEDGHPLTMKYEEAIGRIEKIMKVVESDLTLNNQSSDENSEVTSNFDRSDLYQVVTAAQK